MTTEPPPAAGRGAPMGQPVERHEDPGLLTGESAFTDDLDVGRALHLAVVRSPHGHGVLESVEAAGAASMPGVRAVLTADDVDAAGVPGTLPGESADYATVPDQPILAADRVRYDGEPVAAVVARDPVTAAEAANAVDVVIEPLEATVGLDAALDPGGPPVHEAAPDNVCYRWDNGGGGAAAAAFEAADHTVELSLVNNRLIPTALEPRTALAAFSPSSDELVVHLSCQKPHHTRDELAGSLGLSPGDVTVKVPSVGGGFGAKMQPYAGHTLAAFAAMQLGRPVKWRAGRTEDARSMVHARHQHCTAALALDDDGTVRGLRTETVAEVGAYATLGAAGIPTRNFAGNLCGPYGIEAVHAEVTGVFTNTAPISAYRGAGRPEATYLVERLIGTAARDLGFDPVELRRRNFIPEEAFPVEVSSGQVYDSGDYAGALEAAIDRIGYAGFLDRQARARAEGRYLGIGFSSFVESGGGGPGGVESGLVRLTPAGDVVVRCGTTDNGQGHATTYAQIAAGVLGVDAGAVDVAEGDTDVVPEGHGTGGSRSVPTGGSAIHRSAERVREKARRIAAHHLEAAAEDVDFDDGVFAVRGAPERSIAIGEVAGLAYAAATLPAGDEPGLEATTYYDPANNTFSFGTHVAVVEADPETGGIELLRYLSIDDVGVQINPKLVEGQVHGGVVQGIGQALYERTDYADNGALRTASLTDYALPRAHHLPDLETGHTVTPCPHNPLGAKGVGEAGSIAAPPAVVNAAVDALAPLGVRTLDMPLSSERVWAAVRSAAAD